MDNPFELPGLKKEVPDLDAFAPFLKRLEQAYAVMDMKYRQAAGIYAFHCNGCEDNCCRTRFYHHTVVEYLYLLKGFQGLGRDLQQQVRRRAEQVSRKTAQADETGSAIRRMCPLNVAGRCCVYAYRPMICRLHGIAHEIRHPARGVLRSPGCEAFTVQCGNKAYHGFDRTPLYTELAKIEADLKAAAGIVQKFKLTVAQMLAPDQHQPFQEGPF